MKKLIVSLMLACFVILNGVATFAAPIRPVGPVDVTGTISEVKWVPEKAVKGIPRMTGSAAKDRVVFPHFLVRLADYEGVSAEAAVTMTRYVEWPANQNQEIKGRPSFILLKIDYGDRNFLKKGMRIRVLGYTVAGDEGGTWTSFTGIEIIKSLSHGDAVRRYLQTAIESPGFGDTWFCTNDVLGEKLKGESRYAYVWAVCMEYYLKDGRTC